VRVFCSMQAFIQDIGESKLRSLSQ
jgi:hypothetical protein